MQTGEIQKRGVAMSKRVMAICLAVLIFAVSCASCANTPAPEPSAESSAETVTVPTTLPEPFPEETEATRPEGAVDAISMLPEGKWTDVTGLRWTQGYYSSGVGVPIDREMLRSVLEDAWVYPGEAQEESKPAYVFFLEIGGQEWCLSVGSDGTMMVAEMVEGIRPGRKSLSEQKSYFRDDGTLYSTLTDTCFSVSALLPELPWDYAEWVLFTADGSNLGQGDLDAEWMRELLLKTEFTAQADGVQSADDVYSLFFSNSELEPLHHCVIEVYNTGAVTFKIQMATGIVLQQNYTVDQPLYDILTEKFFPSGK